ncbi:MAG: hypothetical protein M3461_10105 [Pseudomonadota bacterium]|nr:hypothetical protein [Pseudomonadota bacterium]
MPQHTAEHINQRIREQTEANIARYAAAGPEAIDRRLKELEREWDMELRGQRLDARAHRGCAQRDVLLPGVVAALLLQHAIPVPVPVFRRLGFRTQTDIDYERYALKALRGDLCPDRAAAAFVGHATLTQVWRPNL